LAITARLLSTRKTTSSPSCRSGGSSRYPERTAFIDAGEPHAGREITAALDRGYAVVLISAGGHEQSPQELQLAGLVGDLD
jgi:hypothetical protein